MPTVREKLNKALGLGIPLKEVKAKMLELGIRKEDLDIDYETAKKIGANRNLGIDPVPVAKPQTIGEMMRAQGIATDIGPSGLGTAEMMGPDPTVMPAPYHGASKKIKTRIDAQRAEFAKKEQQKRDVERVKVARGAAKELHPEGIVPTEPTRGTIEEQEEVHGASEPSDELKSRQIMEAAQKPETVRVGGVLTGPVETAKFIGGFISGFPEVFTREAKRALEKGEAAAKKKREEKLKEGYSIPQGALHFADDVATVAGGLATLIGVAAVGTPVLRTEAQLKDTGQMGLETGRDIVPGILGSAAEALKHPLDTSYVAPFTTALNVIPAGKAVVATGKATGAFSAALGRIEDMVVKTIAKSPTWYGRMISGMETGDAHANVILDEMVERARKIDEVLSESGGPRTADKVPGREGVDVAAPAPAVQGVKGPGDVASSRLGKRAIIPKRSDKGPGVIEYPADEIMAGVSRAEQRVGARVAEDLSHELELLADSTRGGGITPEQMGRIYEGALAQAADDANIVFLLQKKNAGLLDEVAKQLGYSDGAALKAAIKSEGTVILSKDDMLTAALDEAVGKARRTPSAQKFMADRAKLHLRNKLRGSVQGAVMDAESVRFLGKNKTAGISKSADPRGPAHTIEEAAQELASAIKVGERMPQFLRTSAPGIVKQQLQNELRKLGRGDIADHIGKMKAIRDGKVSGVEGLANEYLAGYLKPSEMGKTHALVAELLGSLPKTVALPMNPKAMMNNIIGNEVLTSIAVGQIPGTNLIKAFWRKGKELAGKFNPQETQFIEASKRMGLFNTNVVKADIATTESLAGGRVTEAMQQAREAGGAVGGKLMAVGDEVYKIPVAYHEFTFAQEALGKMKPGESITMRVGERVKVRVTRLEGAGEFEMKYFSRGEDVTAARTKIKGQSQVVKSGTPNRKPGDPDYVKPDNRLMDVMARYGKQAADSYYFDYTNVPGWIAWLRKQPVVGAASPFYTWAWKALDLPGKPGLLTSVLRGPRTLTSTSRAVNMSLAKAHTGTAMRRAGLIGAIHNETQYDPDIARMMSWNPKAPRAVVTKAYGNPSQLAVARYSSANFLEPTLTALDLVSQGIEKIISKDTIKEMMESEEGSDRFVALSIKLREDATKKRDPVPAALNLFGAGGTILMDTYNKALEAEDQGKTFSVWDDIITNLYVPSPLRTYVRSGGFNANERFKGMDEGEKPIETAVDFHLRNVIGLGYQAISTPKQYKRFRTGVKKEMESMLEIWKARRMRRLAESMSDNEALAKAEDMEDKMKTAVDDSIEYMDMYWEQKGIDTGE